MLQALFIEFPQWITDFDLAVDNFIHLNWTNAILDPIFTFITHLGDKGILWIVLALILMCFKKTRKIGIVMGIALVLGALFGNITLKNIFERPRPFATEGALLDAPYLIPEPSEFSFPSGHTTSSFAAAFGIFLYHKKWGIPALVMAALIAFSRLYVYVHFLTDILVGMLLGIGCAILAYYLWNKWLEKIAVRIWNAIFKNHTIEHF
jgi:undecaprenyl-diphosphatase